MQAYKKENRNTWLKVNNDNVCIQMFKIPDTADEITRQLEPGVNSHMPGDTLPTKRPVTVKFKDFHKRLQQFKEKTNLEGKNIVITANLTRSTLYRKNVTKLDSGKVWTSEGQILTKVTGEFREVQSAKDKNGVQSEMYLFFTLVFVIGLRILSIIYETVFIYWRYNTGTTMYFDFYFYFYLLVFIYITSK